MELVESIKAFMPNKYFFKADAIHHYRIEIEGKALESLKFDMHLTQKEKLKRQIIFDDAQPTSIDDYEFIAQLEDMGFVKHTIGQSSFEQIQSIFSLKEASSIELAYCGAVFRDVLVFYLNQKITGMAKVCFSCGHYVIVGTSVATTNFGQGGDYQLLRKLLNV